MCIDEHLFKYNAHRDRALNYKSEEVQLTAVDELHVEQDAEGHVMKQICRVRLFFLGFLSGMCTTLLCNNVGFDELNVFAAQVCQQLNWVSMIYGVKAKKLLDGTTSFRW